MFNRMYDELSKILNYFASHAPISQTARAEM